MTNLLELNLTGTKVGDAGVEHLKGLTHLVNLDLNKTRVTDAGLKYLGRLERLFSLKLTETGISDDGLANLKPLPLGYLDLTSTKITDKGLKHLQGLGLKQLWLLGTKTTPEGRLALRRANPNLTILATTKELVIVEEPFGTAEDRKAEAEAEDRKSNRSGKVGRKSPAATRTPPASRLWKWTLNRPDHGPRPEGSGRSVPVSGG